MLAVEDSPAGRFLDQLGTQLPRPRAIVVASAHFMASGVAVGAAPQPATVHDFGGFPEPLYRIRVTKPGSGDFLEPAESAMAKSQDERGRTNLDYRVNVGAKDGRKRSSRCRS